MIAIVLISAAVVMVIVVALLRAVARGTGDG